MEAHWKRQLEWAKAHANWTLEYWLAVVFSDESKFNCFDSDEHEWCWRRPGEGFDEHYTKKVVKHRGGSIMVWECVTATGLGQIYHIEGNMNANLYVQILDDELLGILGNLGIKKKDIYFQQDNDHKYTSKLASEWWKKKRLNKINWPPQSLDMNIIDTFGTI